jgi:hypothetical protein
MEIKVFLHATISLIVPSECIISTSGVYSPDNILHILMLPLSDPEIKESSFKQIREEIGLVSVLLISNRHSPVNAFHI